MSWTNNKLSVFCAALSALLCNAASANIEPSSYDAKSIAAGTKLPSLAPTAKSNPTSDLGQSPVSSARCA
jgi:hypothetical protein